MMCYLVCQLIRDSVEGDVPSRYEPRIVFHFSFQAKDWIKAQCNEYYFVMREIECEGF